MTEQATLKGKCAEVLDAMLALTVVAIRARFRHVVMGGTDWNKAARKVHSRLTWPWTPEEWDAEVERIAFEIQNADEEDDEWLTAEFIAMRESGVSC